MCVVGRARAHTWCGVCRAQLQRESISNTKYRISLEFEGDLGGWSTFEVYWKYNRLSFQKNAFFKQYFWRNAHNWWKPHPKNVCNLSLKYKYARSRHLWCLLYLAAQKNDPFNPLDRTLKMKHDWNCLEHSSLKEFKNFGDSNSTQVQWAVFISDVFKLWLKG